MIKGTIEPIGHIPPYKRIDLNPPPVPRPDTGPLEGISIFDKCRIWQAIVSTAEASNVEAAE